MTHCTVDDRSSRKQNAAKSFMAASFVRHKGSGESFGLLETGALGEGGL